MILARSFTYLFSVLSLVASQTPSNCSAVVTLNSSLPGHGSFYYHDIIVENTGLCPITDVFAAITLPPYEDPFAYTNINNETGELYGLSYPMSVGSIGTGGTIVLNSARIPIVTLGSVECEASCSAPSTRSVRTPPPPPVTSIKVEIEWGANPRWISLSLIDEMDTSEVWLVDSKNSRQLMKRENWDSKTAYSFSPSEFPMALPLSLELKSYQGELIVLKDFITSFSYAVLDTKSAFPGSSAIIPTDYSIHLVSHPISSPHWIALTPYGTLANKVKGISIKAANTNNYIAMNPASTGFFTLSSPDLALQVPISAQLLFEDDSLMTLENVVSFNK